jgi:hypothetical protein
MLSHISCLADIFDELDTYLEAAALACSCLGGGKISHNAELKQIEVFGTSQVTTF